MVPLQSRFFIVRLEPYTYEQFYQITVQLLTQQQHKVKLEIDKTTYAVWNKMKSGNVRDCVKIGRMAKSIDDVNFYCGCFLNEIRFKVDLEKDMESKKKNARFQKISLICM